MVRCRQKRNTQEERAKNDCHPGQRNGGIACLRLLKSGNAIGDGLDSSHGRAACGKGSQDQEERERLYCSHVGIVADDGLVLEHKGLHQPNADQQESANNEEVGR